MAKTGRQRKISTVARKPFSFMDRLKEIDTFFPAWRRKVARG